MSEDWEPTTDLEKIAVAIGYHFWHCENDRMAYICGFDAANDVMKMLSA